MSYGKTFKGTSTNGNFQEALDDAIAKAQEAETGADIITRWRFSSADGEQGGFSPRNIVNVEIEVTGRG